MLNIDLYNKIISILKDTKYDDKNYYGDSRGKTIRDIANKKGIKSVMNCLISILLEKDKKQFWREITSVIWNGGFDEDYILGSGEEDKFIATLLYCTKFSPDLNFNSREAIWPFITIFKHVSIEADFFPRNDKGYYNPLEDPDILRELENLKKNYGS